MKIWIRAAALIAIFVPISPVLSAQWPLYPTAKAPRTPGGQVNLAAPTPRTADGTPDLSGIWEVVRTGRQAIVGADVPALSRTSPFWNIGAGLEGGLPLRPWARNFEPGASRTTARTIQTPIVFPSACRSCISSAAEEDHPDAVRSS